MFRMSYFARASDPWTSHAAGAGAQHTASRGRLAVLVALLDRPMNDYELSVATSWRINNIRKRRLECVRGGLVRAHLDSAGTHVSRETGSGRLGLVWEIVLEDGPLLDDLVGDIGERQHD